MLVQVLLPVGHPFCGHRFVLLVEADMLFQWIAIRMTGLGRLLLLHLIAIGLSIVVIVVIVVVVVVTAWRIILLRMLKLVTILMIAVVLLTLRPIITEVRVLFGVVV